MDSALERVRAYWQANPCAAKVTAATQGTAVFYREVAAVKDTLEPYRADFAGFQRSRDRRVLEIGVGLGVDLVRFAVAGADAVGVDLTEAAVEATRRQLDQRGLDAEVIVADAEALPFEDASFDIVYSWGVLHHAPSTEAAVAEVRRVLRPGGEARVMLYHSRSWFAGAVWARQTLRERRMMSVAEALARGLESPGTQAFTVSETMRMFSRFFIATTIQRRATAYDRKLVGPLAKDAIGWHLLYPRPLLTS